MRSLFNVALGVHGLFTVLSSMLLQYKFHTTSVSEVERERVGDLKKTVLPLSLANWSGGE